jgi:hypothetical protein
MIRKKTLVFISLVLAIIYYFIRTFFGSYGPVPNDTISSNGTLLALASILILLFVYITTNWRVDLKDFFILRIYDLLILWIFISYVRSMLNISGAREIKSFLLGDITGLSLFPILFFIVGINTKYFSLSNKLFAIYCALTFVISLIFINYFELQFFLLIPLFYIIVTYPLQSPKNRIFTFLIAVTVIITSVTNRAGVLRILISYLIVVIFYMVLKMKVNKKLINVVLFLALIAPFYLLYQGINGKDVFKMILGENKEQGYRQENLRSDTRTFLYVDVFRDLEISKAFIFGKGINAGYASDSFETFNRTAVEVGFLQILLKCGIVGFLLYIILIVSAIFKALNKSENYFMKYLGLLLCGYVLMFFIENIIAFNLFNVIIWCVVGMCHSNELRALNDKEIKDLFLNINPPENVK